MSFGIDAKNSVAMKLVSLRPRAPAHTKLCTGMLARATATHGGPDVVRRWFEQMQRACQTQCTRSFRTRELLHATCQLMLARFLALG